MIDNNGQLDWLSIRLVPQMSRARFYALMQRFPDPAAVYAAGHQEITRVRGFDADLAASVLGGRGAPAALKQAEEMQKLGVKMLVRGSADFPYGLTHSALAPPILFVKGHLTAEDKYSVALVGSRHATTYGRSVARELAGGLARYGLTIISGFARGIDGEAHLAAIKAGGRTIGVLGNGLDVCYPSEHRSLVDQVTAHGALVSEYPLGTAPERFNFPERNHVIAAMALGTVVVEAAEKSGSLITSRLALEENRFVFAVPGDITRNNSRGANGLIQQGARMVQRPRDVLVEMKDVLRGYLDLDQLDADAAGETTPTGDIRLDETEPAGNETSAARAERQKIAAENKKAAATSLRGRNRDWVDDLVGMDPDDMELMTAQLHSQDREPETRAKLQQPPEGLGAAGLPAPGHNGAPGPVRPVQTRARPAAGTLSADEQFLVDLLHHEAMVFDDLADRAFGHGLDVPRLTSLLMKLELRQVIRQLPGRYYVLFT